MIAAFPLALLALVLLAWNEYAAGHHAHAA